MTLHAHVHVFEDTSYLPGGRYVRVSGGETAYNMTPIQLLEGEEYIAEWRAAVLFAIRFMHIPRGREQKPWRLGILPNWETQRKAADYVQRRGCVQDIVELCDAMGPEAIVELVLVELRNPKFSSITAV